MEKISKEDVKIAIDELPQSSLEKLLQFIEHLKENKIEKKPMKSFRLNGQFDSAHIRTEAYE